MGLFDQILGAVGNSNQPAGLDNLLNIATTVQQLGSGLGVDSSTMQSILSVVGKQIQSSLQAKEATEGSEAVQDLINQFAGTSANSQAVDNLFSADIQAKVAENVAQAANVDASTVQQLLPTLIPVVLSFLQSSGNPLLSKVLYANVNIDTELSGVINLATRFLGI